MGQKPAMGGGFSLWQDISAASWGRQQTLSSKEALTTSHRGQAAKWGPGQQLVPNPTVK